VDTLGLILAVVVHSVGVQDYHGARLVRMRLLGRFPRLSFFWADGGYDKGALSDWAARFLGRALSGPRALSAGSSCRLGPLVGWVLQIVPKNLCKNLGYVCIFRRAQRIALTSSQASLLLVVCS